MSYVLDGDRLRKWAVCEIGRIIESDFEDFREEPRPGIIACINLLRKWRDLDLPVSDLTIGRRASLMNPIDRIRETLVNQLALFLEENFGVVTGFNSLEREWALETREKLFAVAAAADTAVSNSQRGRNRSRAILNASAISDGRWRVSRVDSDLTEMVFALSADDRLRLHFIFAGSGSRIGYRLCFGATSFRSVPVTYERLLGFPGSMLPARHPESLQKSAIAVFRESRRVLEAVALAGC